MNEMDLNIKKLFFGVFLTIIFFRILEMLFDNLDFYLWYTFNICRLIIVETVLKLKKCPFSSHIQNILNRQAYQTFKNHIGVKKWQWVGSLNSIARNWKQTVLPHWYMGVNARKPVFRGLWTTQAQISLHIHTDWSAPFSFACWKVSYLNLLQAKCKFSS